MSYDYIQTTGVVVADTSTVKAEVEAEFKVVFGDDLDVSSSTPQGLLISAETLSRDGIARNNASLANQINPNVSGGIFLDAIMALTGIGRDAATYSTVDATLTGVSGVVIPAGTRVSTTDGDVFALVSNVTLPGTGSFKAEEAGPISADAGALNTIVDAVLGWDAVTNASAATLGALQQSDADARRFRNRTLGVMGSSQAVSITSALWDVSGVTSVVFRENYTGATAVIDGITLVKNSIWCCVKGGSDTDVAQAIQLYKSGGCAFNGATSIQITEAATGQAYTVLFDRPDLISILVKVTIASGSTVNDPVSAVKNSVVSYATAEITGGVDVSPFELAGQINIDNPGIFVKKVEVKKSTDSDWSSSEISIALDEIAQITTASVTVVQS